MKVLSENEKKLLSIIARFSSTNRQANTDSIVYLMERKIPSLLDTWEQTTVALLDKGIISCRIDNGNGMVYSITEYGEKYSDGILRDNSLSLYFYNEFYRRAEESEAHSEFCRLVYGRYFCQHGMLDMKQLDRLIEVSKLTESSHVLELGCGNGLITEYISDITGCHITGIDIAEQAIEHANMRTLNKRDRIAFNTKYMENLDYEEHSFDAVISIDTLYFVGNLESAIKSIVKVLKPKGSMYIFYHVPPDTCNTPGFGPAKCSLLGKALDKLNVKYQTIDFTKENNKHWELKKQVLLKLRTKFEEEGNMFLYNNRMEECMGNLGEFYRFLYIVEKE